MKIRTLSTRVHVCRTQRGAIVECYCRAIDVMDEPDRPHESRPFVRSSSAARFSHGRPGALSGAAPRETPRALLSIYLLLLLARGIL